MENVIITTTKEFVILKIPKKTFTGIVSRGKKKLTEDEVLKLFAAGKKEYQARKLKSITNLSQLV
jgi:hypothetical protein